MPSALSSLAKHHGWRLERWRPGVYRLRDPRVKQYFAQIKKGGNSFWFAELRESETGNLVEIMGATGNTMRDVVHLIVSGDFPIKPA